MFAVSIAIVLAAILADQLIKLYINSSFELFETHGFIPHVLSLTHIRNSGAAWSIMEGKTWFLILLPVVMIAAALIYMYRIRGGSRLALISLALVVGGGIGNLIDRIRLHEVIDYLKLELFDFPIFNFADMCVVVGAILFCVYMFFFDESDKQQKEPRNMDTNSNESVQSDNKEGASDEQ